MDIQDVGIDIVVLNCNNQSYIQTCLKSIIDNTPAPYNLIVVDQNSQDGSKEYLTENKGISHLILNKRNTGQAEGKNQGIRASKYPWIAFIHSDVEINDKEWLDKIWNFTIDHHIGVIMGEGFVHISQSIDSKLKMAFCLIRKKCLDEIGIFDNNFMIYDDMDWFLRLSWNHYWKMVYCPELNVRHYSGKTIKEGIIKNKFNEFIEQDRKRLYKKYSKEAIKEFIDSSIFIDEETKNNLSKEVQYA